MNHEADEPELPALEGQVGTPPPPEEPAASGEGGVDFWVFGLVAVVVALISIQNVWLRRKAERERGEDSETS